MVPKPQIADLERLTVALPAAEQALFRRIYRVVPAVGELKLPEAMQPWVENQFGSAAAVTRQRITRVANLITREESIFNRLRRARPADFTEKSRPESPLNTAGQNDLFSKPEENTPEDLFGRVKGRYCVTAANVARYDGRHGLIIFNDFDPLHFGREQIIDYIDVGWAWAQRAHAREPRARYFFLIWNCLGRAGASIRHGHAQVMLAEHRHYARIDALRQAAFDYRQQYGSDYFSDLFRLHRSLGCALEKDGVKVLASLTPFKDNEVIILAGDLSLPFKERLYEVLACFRDRLGIMSFNLALATPPLAETEESWEGFPVIARLVDRGDAGSLVSDIGGMEIYAAGIIASDPFDLGRELKGCLA